MDIRQLKRALRRKLDAVEDRKSHHVYYYVLVNEREMRAAKFSHSSSGQLPEIVLSDTAKRLSLTRQELAMFVECSLTGDDVLPRLVVTN